MKVELKNYVNRHGAASKAKRLGWELVWAVAFRTTPRWCLNGWRCWLLRQFGAKMGTGVRIQGGAKVWQPWKLEIGDYSWVDSGVELYAVDEIKIGANAVVSAGAFICTATHDIGSESFELKTRPVEIGDGAWIGARAIVLPGVKIGENAVVGAGAVVTKDVEAGMVVGGNPATVIKQRC